MNREEMWRLLTHLGIEKLKKNNKGDFIGLCPLHLESRPSWGIKMSEAHHPFNCFGCHRSGTLVGLVMSIKQMKYRDALRFIRGFGSYEADGSDISVLTKILDPKEEQAVKAVSLADWEPYVMAERRVRANAYLKTRKIKLRPNMLQPGYDKKQKRVLFPYVVDGTFVGADGRYIGTRRAIPRFIPYFGLEKGLYLFHPYNKSRPKNPQKLVLVEGCVDAYAVANAYYGDPDEPLVGAVSHSEISPRQLKAVVQIGLPTIPLFDNDDAGMEGIEIFEKLIGDDVPCLSNFKYPIGRATDPAKLSHTKLKKLIESARSRTITISLP